MSETLTLPLDADGTYLLEPTDDGRVRVYKNGRLILDEGGEVALVFLVAAQRIADLTQQRQVLDIDAPQGFETAEVTSAKDEVIDLLNTEEGEDNIAVAEAIVTALIREGWRPTVTRDA